ncbi:MAG: DMT family transporter [bacterium]|nr:DMT family transporter [bacterium]
MRQSSVLIIASAVFFGTYGIWAKMMAGTFGAFNQAWIRAVLILLILVPVGLYLKRFKKIARIDWKWFAVVSLAGSFNQAPYFYGFEHLTVGTTTLLFYLSLTVGTFVIGKLFFNEYITKSKLGALALAAIGLFVIYQFTLADNQMLAAGSTLLSGFLSAIYMVFSKKISNTYSEIQILSVLFISMFLVNLPISFLRGEVLPNISIGSAWLGQFGYICAMLLANGLVISGFKKIEPSIGGLLGLFEIVFAAIFGVLLFGEVVTRSLLLGGSCILIAAGLPDIMYIAKKLHKK